MEKPEDCATQPCPYELDVQNLAELSLQALQLSDAELKSAVPEKNRVTPSWLDVSLDAQQPLLPIPYERVEMQPLPHSMPLTGMKKIT